MKRKRHGRCWRAGWGDRNEISEKLRDQRAGEV